MSDVDVYRFVWCCVFLILVGAGLTFIPRLEKLGFVLYLFGRILASAMAIVGIIFPRD